MLLETIGYGFEVHELDEVLVRESVARSEPWTTG